MQEKHQAEERRLKELADKVATLEHERDQLQRAVDSASSGPQVIPISLPLYTKHQISFYRFCLLVWWLPKQLL